MAPRDAIVEIGYVISGALFELIKELNTKEAVQNENIQIQINELKINILDLE